MSPHSVREYLETVRPRYRTASRPAKKQLLDEAERVTGYHRKTLIRRLRPAAASKPVRRGRPNCYGPEVVAALKTLWEANDRSCGKRLVPFLPTLLESLERHAEITVPPVTRKALLALSPATADRLLASHRTLSRQHPYTQRRAPSPLQAMVPIRTFGEWSHLQPGEIQADLVAHCGDRNHGSFLTTLVAVDVASSWTELEPVKGMGYHRVKSGLHSIRDRLPFPLRAFHADNGAEFLNYPLCGYCRENGIRFTRGRPYKKNDQAWVEQRNWTAVRRLVGYERFESPQAFQVLTQLYPPMTLYLNFFHPVRKLIAKTRNGAHVTKRYDQPRTPAQRLVDAGVLEPGTCRRLKKRTLDINPLALKKEIDQLLPKLWKLAERTRSRVTPL